MKKLVSYSIILWVVVSCTNSPSNLTFDQMVGIASEEVNIIKPDEVMKIMDSEEVYTVIDVRQRDEFYYGYIPGSVNIPRGSIEFNINNELFWENEGLYMPLKEETIILYCKKGKRSMLAAQTLQHMGYKKILVLKDGWKNWELSYPDYTEKNLEMLAGGGEKHDDGGGC